MARPPDSPFQRAKDKARALAASPPPPPPTEAKGAPHRPRRCCWRTGLGRGALLDGIVAAYAGAAKVAAENGEGGGGGEPALRWAWSRCLSRPERTGRAPPLHKVYEGALRFMISFVLLRILAQPHFDLSVLDEESGELASTVIVVDGSCSDPAGGGALRRARDAVLLFLRSSLLYYRMWRGGSLPEIVASSEWRADREDARRRLHTIRRFMAFARSTLMPPARRQRYWYVNLVATQPKFQRRGYGTRVIRAVCDLADEERVDLYLESAGDRNRRFYESAGFQVAASLRLDQIPPGEGGGAAGRSSQPAMEMYAMVRRHAKQD